nr:Ig-like domain-containing protein [Microbacterium testaceum]
MTIENSVDSTNGAAAPVPSRRAVVGAAAFAVPAIAMVATSPAFAQTGQRQISMTATPVPGSAASSTDGGSGDQVSGAAAGYEFNVVVTVTDAGTGAALAGQSVALSGPSGVSFGQANGTTSGSGQYSTVASISASGGGSATIAAASPGTGGTVSTSTSLIYRARSVVVSVSPSTVAPGGTATVTARVLSGSGTGLVGEPVTFSGAGVSFAQASGTTNSSGEYATTITSTGASGTSSTITASSAGAGGAASGSASLSVLGRQISVTLSPDDVRTDGGTSTVIVTVTNGAGAALSGQAVSLSAASGVSLAATSGITNSAGVFTTQATVTATAAGSTTISASSSGSGGTISGSANLDYYVALTASLSRASLPAAFNGWIDLTVTYRDVNGPVSGETVTVTKSSSTGSNISFTFTSGTGNGNTRTGTTDSSGTVVFRCLANASSRGEVLTVMATAGGATARTTLNRT